MDTTGADLAIPLHEVTFVVVDLETTGMVPAGANIAEVGAVALRGGATLGTFQSLVRTGAPIPAPVGALTGIDGGMLTASPAIDSVLPAFLEFAAGSVLVGHNVRFDLAFLQAALRERGYRRLTHPVIDTYALARLLLTDESPNRKLATLAAALGLDHRPIHRALQDALATGELLHRLLERAGTIGATSLDDLLALPTTGRHPHLHKLRLATALPRVPGVCIFRAAGGAALHVDHGTDVHRVARTRIVERPRAGRSLLLAQTAAIDHVVTATELQSAVLADRLRRRLRPRFDRPARPAWIHVGRSSRGRLRTLVSTAPETGDGRLVGPFPSIEAARRVLAALRSYGDVDVWARAAPRFGDDMRQVLAPLEVRMSSLCAGRRFEEAAVVRDAVTALGLTLHRQQRIEEWRRAGRVIVEIDGVPVEIVDGRLASRSGADDGAASAEIETALVVEWLDAHAARCRVLDGDATPHPRPPVPPRASAGAVSNLQS